jgi:hypothetical protein
VLGKLFTGVLLSFLVLACGNSTAQGNEDEGELPERNVDSTYIADYTSLLTARAFLLFQNASLLINPPGDRISKIVYNPNVNLRIGIAGFWKWFGLGLSLVNPVFKTDRGVYGKTSTLDLRVNVYGRSIAGELFLQRYTGFYISSPERTDGSYYIIPAMRTFSVGIAGYYIYNSGKFSIRAAFIQSERQKKSAGSLVVRPSFLYTRVSSDQGIIPGEIADIYQISPASQVTGGTFYSIGLSPGYVYTFVFMKNFYVTAAAFPGVAAQFSSFSNKTGTFTDHEFAFQLGGRFALGYNSEKWFLGGSVQSGFNEVPDKLNNALFSYDVAQFRFWGGTRFDIFKKKKKTAAGE